MSTIAPLAHPELVGPSVAERADARPRDLAASFSSALERASALEATSSRAAEQFAAGDPSVGIHEVVIASEQANIALKFATTLKNKALDAYRELMATQV